MNYSIELNKDVTKFLEHCDKRIAIDFHKKSKIIAENPYQSRNLIDSTRMS